MPFLVVRGYRVGGEPEPPERYVAYCLREGDWSAAEFKPRGGAEKRAALAKLLASPRWKVPLTEGEKAYLASQIE